MLNIGVLGAGHLGKIHINCIKQIAKYNLVGFYDADKNTAEKVSAELEVKSFDTIDELIDVVDVVDIVTPTIAHFECASKALNKKKHVFIEKPIVATPEEAHKLIKLAEEVKVKVQVGHVERFNPAFLSMKNHIQDPVFIEAHRLALFNPRGTDVPVVLDLMVHDIDIVLSLIKSPIKNIHANGVAIVSKTPDITTARIEFENGAVANLTASRISLKNMRKARIFQRDAYITIDFLEKKSEIVRIKDNDNSDPMAMIIDLGDGNTRQISFEKLEITPVNAIQKELECFNDAIINNTTPSVTIQDGVRVLQLAYDILDAVNQSLQPLK